MKTRDKLAQRIQATGVAIGVVLLGTALLFNSIGYSSASQEEFDFPDELTQKDIQKLQSAPAPGNGKYMMTMSNVSHEGKLHWYVLVWNTETGQSKMYEGSSGKSGLSSPGSHWSPPSNPL